MPDIEFQCHQCGLDLVVDQEGAGLETECPSCSAILLIPEPSVSFAESPTVHTTAVPAFPTQESIRHTAPIHIALEQTRPVDPSHFSEADTTSKRTPKKPFAPFAGKQSSFEPAPSAHRPPMTPLATADDIVILSPEKKRKEVVRADHSMSVWKMFFYLVLAIAWLTSLTTFLNTRSW